jgi:putative DNA primase/helicase
MDSVADSELDREAARRRAIAIDMAEDRRLDALEEQARRDRQLERTTARTFIGGNDPFNATEVGDAEHFESLNAGRVLFDHADQRWYLFNGRHWQIDATNQIVQLAIDSSRKRLEEAIKLTGQAKEIRVKWALAGESKKRVDHCLSLAGSIGTLKTDGRSWDPDPMLLGVANGIVDLRNGTLRQGLPVDMVRLVSPVTYDAAAKADRWTRFVLEVMAGRNELVEYLQMALGYGITGMTTEQSFWIFYGGGSNGKSTLLDVIKCIVPMHAFTMKFPTDAWTESLSDYERAQLVGRRFVVASETEQRKALHSDFLKSLTGDGSVDARHPYGRPFNFTPTAKFFLAVNHKPTIRDTSHGMWRRVKLIPFDRQFALDQTLKARLEGEAPGVLRWLVDGAKKWHLAHLTTPEVVTAATDTYRAENDTLTTFISDRCIVADYAQVPARALFEAYKGWCVLEGVRPEDAVKSRTFGETIKARFAFADDGRRVTYQGLGLREVDA